MELAASFFYVSAGLAIWVIGALITIILVELVKTLKSIQQATENVKSSIASLEGWKSAIVSAVSGAVTGLITKKTKGGGSSE